MGALFLLRHGETEWSKSGRHTGRTDLALTTYGEEQARAAGALLAGRRFELVLTSPLRRAAHTAELAGLVGAEVEPNLVEWDYGGYEGLTSAQIQAAGHPGWRVFHDGVVPGATPGETLAEVAARASAVLSRVRPALARGDVALVGHGHALRVLTTVWLERPADLAQQLELGSGSVSRLGSDHDVPSIEIWNAGSSL
jgi:broad specificity phosphatase PhoE